MENITRSLEVFAFNTKTVFEGVNTKSGKSADYSSLQGLFNEVFLWAGIIAVLTIVVSGVMYTTSAGDPGKIGKAKTALAFSIIGLLLVLLASVIVNLVLGLL